MRVLETALYAEDVTATAAFYRDVLGLREIEAPDEHSAALRHDDGVLLIFDPRRTSGAGRFVPPHGASGPGHVAFGVDSLDGWAARVEVEREIDWPRGGRSLYFRDPAGNSVELVAGPIWEP